MSTRKIKRKTVKGPQVNYAGDGTLISRDKVRRLALFVYNNFWKHSSPLPGDFILEINLMSSGEVRKLNRKYLDRDRETDVIAFSFLEGDGFCEDPPVLGQIVISTGAVSDQAEAFGHSRRKELRLLIIHGLLHIAGWSEGEEIEICQQEILKKTDRI